MINKRKNRRTSSTGATISARPKPNFIPPTLYMPPHVPDTLTAGPLEITNSGGTTSRLANFIHMQTYHGMETV